MYQYQVTIYQESGITAFLPGGGKVDPVKFSEHLNKFARTGWRVVTVERESRRFLFFWKREAFVSVLEKQLQAKAA